jgi:hypothetical protein
MLNILFEKNQHAEASQKGGKNNFFFVLMLVGFSSALMFYSCQKVDKPYLKMPVSIKPTGDTIRKILFEDYTGHRCSNCPRVAYALHNFQETSFPKQVIGLAIHTKFEGTSTSPDVSHPADFRTTVGDRYYKDFLVQGLPTGIINRRNKASGFNSGGAANWKDSISAILSKAPDALLKITNTYDTTLRKLTSSIKCSFLNTLPGTYNLVVLLTQDNIISPQDNNQSTNYPPYAAPIATNYKHMHVLRDCIDGSGSSGTGILIGSNLLKGTSITKDFVNFTIPDSYPTPATSYSTPVVPKNCNVVAFIYNTVTNEVVQAEDAKLIK